MVNVCGFDFMKILNDNKFSWDEKALELLLAMEKVNPSRRHKRNMTSVVDDVEKDGAQTAETKTAPESQAGMSIKTLPNFQYALHKSRAAVSVKGSTFQILLFKDFSLSFRRKYFSCQYLKITASLYKFFCFDLCF